MLRDDVIATIDASEQRLEALAAAARQQPDAPLPESDWTVRDALCHVAARSNDVPTVLGMVDQAHGAVPGAPAAARPDQHAVNSDQIQQRANRGVDDLLAEARQGHAEARQALGVLDEDELAQEMNFGGRGPVKLADLVKMAYTRHLSSHLDAIEQALAR